MYYVVMQIGIVVESLMRHAVALMKFGRYPLHMMLSGFPRIAIDQPLAADARLWRAHGFA